jgi:hypothetical protein
LLRTYLLERGGLVTVAVLAVYVWLAPAHIVDGDNAEFATLGAIGGVAHPSGYPLYVLYLRAWSLLPLEPAHAAAIGTAVIGATTIAVLHAACRTWGARPLAATIAVAIYAAAPVVLRLSTQAEVFALNALVAALVLWLAAERGPVRGAARAGALGLVAGLGLANHLTCIFVAPVGILGIVRAMREALRRSTGRQGIAAAIAIGGLVVGLLPYAYLFVAPDSASSWTRIDDVRALLHHFVRADYGIGTLSARDHDASAADTLALLARTLAHGWLFVVLAGGLAIVGLRVARRTGESRAAFATLAASFVLAGPMLIAKFNIPPIDLAIHTNERFHILPSLLLAIPCALAIDHAGTWLAPRAPAALRSTAVTAVLVLAGFAALVGVRLPQQAAMHSPALATGMRNLLGSLPPDAAIIVSTDDLHRGLGYLQALGVRRDVVVVMWGLVPSDHHRARLARELGVELVAGGERSADSAAVAERIMATGRPLFIDWKQANIAAALPTYPYGLVLRVLPRATAPPALDELFAINHALYASYTFGYAVPHDDRVYATHLHRQYARTWTIIADALGRAGNRDRQAEAIAFAKALAP